MKRQVKQDKYPAIEIDDNEVDVIQLWQHGRDESNVILIERWKLEELIVKALQYNTGLTAKKK